MKTFGISLTPPTGLGIFVAFLLGIAALAVGSAIQAVTGGALADVFSMACAAFVVSLLSDCGARYSQAGYRGLILTLVAAFLTGVLCLAAFTLI